jgi:hypothetical protein
VAQVDENRRPIPATERFIPCDTILLSVGLIPENELTRAAGIPLCPITGGALVDEHRQTAVKGIFACGNVLQVHDLVDYVSDEAELAGEGAADFVKGTLATEKTVSTAAGNGVRYVLPQTVGCNGDAVSLFFRVSEPSGKARLTVRCGNEVLATKTALRTAPGEMEKITLKKGVTTALAADACLTVEREVL